MQAREALFGGSVGSGKTDAILMAALSQVDNKHHQALILRRTFPMLRDLIGRSHELFLPLRARFNRQESVWTFPSGARVEFGFLDADEDKYRYMGRQFSMLGWDELTSWPGDSTDAQGKPVSSAYVYMLSRLRAVEGSGLRLECRATSTLSKSRRFTQFLCPNLSEKFFRVRNLSGKKRQARYKGKTWESAIF